MRRLWVFILFLFVPFFAQAQQARPIEIFYVQPMSVLDRSDIGLEINRRLQAELTELRRLNEIVTAELDAEEGELTKKRDDLSFEEFQPLAEAFDEKSEYERERFRVLSEALNLKKDVWRARLFDRIRNEIEVFAQQRPSVMVYDSRFILAGSPHLDLGPILIERLNEDYAQNKDGIDKVIFAGVDEATRLTAPYSEGNINLNENQENLDQQEVEANE